MRRPIPPVSSPHALSGLGSLCILTAASWLTAPAAASAGEPSGEHLQAHVRYYSQELSTERGTRAVYRRIAYAARTVCPGYDSVDGTVVAQSEECQRKAIARAVAHIGNARLAAVDARAVTQDR